MLHRKEENQSNRAKALRERRIAKAATREIKKEWQQVRKIYRQDKRAGRLGAFTTSIAGARLDEISDKEDQSLEIAKKVVREYRQEWQETLSDYRQGRRAQRLGFPAAMRVTGNGRFQEAIQAIHKECGPQGLQMLLGGERTEAAAAYVLQILRNDEQQPKCEVSHIQRDQEKRIAKKNYIQ